VFEGNFTFDSISTGTVTIDVASIYTGASARDKVLRGNEFFDVEKYPTATYTIKEVKQEGDAYNFIGDLTLMASTKELIVPFEIVQNEEEGIYFIKANVNFDRTAYGMPTYGGVGNEVKLTIDLTLVKN
jgi:polyisoprenoid-binding protein YceI